MTRLLHQAGELYLPKRTILNDDSDLCLQPVLEGPGSQDAVSGLLRQLDVSLSALTICMNEIKNARFTDFSENGIYLQSIVEIAATQTASVFSLVNRLSDCHFRQALAVETALAGHDGDAGRRKFRAKAASSKGMSSLTRRQAEVLALITEGYSSKEGAIRMRISWRTFESHRANIMRKLSARNTADLIRKTLQLDIDSGKRSELVSNFDVS
jgi:DNA-binding CsgD family transcriptional regulator